MKKSEGKEDPEFHSVFVDSLKLLTSIEYEVLELTGKGYTAPEIARKLNNSSNTVTTHGKNIKKKLNINGYGALKHWWRVNCPD